MLNVLHVVPSLDQSYGGPAVSVPSLGNALDRLGMGSFYFSVALRSSSGNNEILAKNNRWFETPASEKTGFGYYSPKAATYLSEIVAKNHVAIIHLHNLWSYPAWMAYKVAKRNGVPLVLSPRSELYPASLKKSRHLKSLARAVYAKGLLRYASGFHATEKTEADSIAQMGLRAPVLVSPNGIDLSIGTDLPTKARARAALGLDVDRRYILFLSRLHQRKNPQMLLRAAIDGGAFRKGWGLIFAGAGEERSLVDTMKALAAAEGLSEFVHFVGHVSGKAKQNCFAASDLFVLPSNFENFGNSIAEALACGVPVVTTTGTPWSIVAEQRAGWIIPPEEQVLAALLNDVTDMSDTALRAIGAAGPAIASRYSWDTAAADMKAFYERDILQLRTES